MAIRWPTWATIWPGTRGRGSAPAHIAESLELLPKPRRISARTVVARGEGGRQTTSDRWHAMPPLPGTRDLVISPGGDYRGSPGVEKELLYVVQTGEGQKTLRPREFSQKCGGKNDPQKIGRGVMDHGDR